MPFIEVLLAIDVLVSFVIGVEDEFFEGKIVTPMLDGLDNGLQFQVM